MIPTLQKMGGIAALIQATTYVVGAALMFTLPGLAEEVDPVQRVAFLAGNQAIMYMANPFIYVVAGIFPVVLALAVYERLKAGSCAMVQTTTVFGLIWAGVVIAAGMVFNIGLRTVVDLAASIFINARGAISPATLWWTNVPENIDIQPAKVWIGPTRSQF